MVHRRPPGRIAVMPAGSTRDPVSVTFDAAAVRLLDRAYATRGKWVMIWLPDPTIRQRSRWLAEGINVGGPDNPTVHGGTGLDAKTRWARAFVRSLNYQKKHAGRSGALRVEVGRHVPASPQFDPAHPERGGFPPRRRIRVQIASAGRAKEAAVTRLPDGDRWAVGPQGQRRRGPRWADPSLRDWA
jgi:hypothetical protein